MTQASLTVRRVTWQELLFDFLAEFGPVRGFLELNVRLSLLTRRLRDHSVKLLSAAGISVGFSNVSHLRCFRVEMLLAFARVGSSCTLN